MHKSSDHKSLKVVIYLEERQVLKYEYSIFI